MGFEFFATRDEQRQWLIDQSLVENVWMFGWSFLTKYFEITGGSDIKNLRPEEEYLFYIGRSGLAYPMWRKIKGGERNDIDFVRSQAIQFVTSFIAEENILIQGRLGIMRLPEYKPQGIDPAPISRWYRQIRKSLSSIMTHDVIVVQRITNGSLKEWRDIGITPGAVAWRRRGGLLKQFAKGSVEFDISPALHPRGKVR